MFKVVVEFTRTDTSANFFYQEYENHRIVTTLKDKFESHPGFEGKEILIDEDHKIAIAMNFKTAEDFLDFTKNNQALLDERLELIKHWCSTNNQTFDHKFVQG